MNRRGIALVVCVWMPLSVSLRASDPPHDGSKNIQCLSCHQTHNAPGTTLTAVAGNVNLCLSCHMPGGLASAKALVAGNQALPAPGLPAGTTAAGTSHRWDSGPAGHISYGGGAATQSTGLLVPQGAYTGPYAKTYTITITTPGNVGTARFSWTATVPGGGSGTNMATATTVALDQGVSMGFVNGAGTSFQLNDKWNLYVRPDLRAPVTADLAARIQNGQIMCSTCHNEHSQAAMPFDPAARTGGSRHFQRVANDSNQMCTDCHAARNVASAAGGSHPVGVSIPGGNFKSPATVPLDAAGNVRCMTCHAVHYAPATDGSLTRVSNTTALCTDCHTNSDTATPAIHLSASSGVLWPGGQYGSAFAAIPDTTQRGACTNCHQPHGWPDASNTAQKYPHLLVEYQENLCFTCHDGAPVKDVKGDFSKTVHHPVLNSQQAAGRSVECMDCHNSHMAQPGVHSYSATATAARNQVSNVLKGASGLAVSYTGLAAWTAPSSGSYSAVAASTYEYQVCFKCHSANSWNFGTAPAGISANGTAAKPAQTDLAQEFSPANRSGHPVVTGLDNYPNSVIANGKKGLTLGMKAPWSTNLGQQTMACTDCHNTDAASPAAQGPHGSAAQFMLRGANAGSWPAVTLSNRATSWCANCHFNGGSTNNVHTTGEHSGRYCYNCHIVIPHGGKMSRLIGDQNGAMPARYAYNNATSTMYIQMFKKAAPSSYPKSNCQASCTGDHSGTVSGGESW